MKSCADCHREHHSGCLYKQGGRNEVRLTLCPFMAALFMVYSDADCTVSKVHSKSSACNCREALISESGYSDRMVPPVGGFWSVCLVWHCPKVDPFATRYNCKLPKFVSAVPDPQGLGSGRSEGILGEPGSLCLFSSISPGKGDQQIVGSPVQEDHSDCSGLAQRAIILGSSESIISDTHLPSQSTQSGESAIQGSPAQGSGESQPS